MRWTISRLLFRSRDGDPRADLEHLTRLVRRYSLEQQQVPMNLEDLLTLNYLKVLPTAPPGLRFVIDRKAVEVRLE